MSPLIPRRESLPRGPGYTTPDLALASQLILHERVGRDGIRQHIPDHSP